MARIAPFPFECVTDDTPPHRFVTVDMTAQTCTIATNLATTKGLTVGETTVAAGEVISVRSVKDTSESYLVEASAVIANGARVCVTADGKAVTDAAGPMIALEAASGLGHLINVISYEAF